MLRFTVDFLQAIAKEYTIPLLSSGMVYFVASTGVTVTKHKGNKIFVIIDDNFTYGGIMAYNDTESSFVAICKNKPVDHDVVISDVKPEAEDILSLVYYPTLSYKNNRVELSVRVENIYEPTRIEIKGDFNKDIILQEDHVITCVNTAIFGIDKWFSFTINGMYYQLYLCKKEKLPTHLLPSAKNTFRLNQPSSIDLVVEIGDKIIEILPNNISIDVGVLDYNTVARVLTANGSCLLFTQEIEINKYIPTIMLYTQPLRCEIDMISKVPIVLVVNNMEHIIKPGERYVELQLNLESGLRKVTIDSVTNALAGQKDYYILI